jgi:transketolase
MDQPARFAAAGWDVQEVDGHDREAVAAAIDAARRTDTPSLIACRTVIGKGAPNLQGSVKTHGAPLGAAEIAATRASLGWPHEPFVVPPAILAAWRMIAARGAKQRHQWQERLTASPRGAAFEAFLAGDAAKAVAPKLEEFRAEHVGKATKVATRKASEMALAVINAACDATVGGSADLTHSNLTVTKGMAPVQPGAYAGRYIHYGIREHAMAAAMNGLALHGGFIPYGGTFLCFADYARGAIRLSALMGQRVVYVMTHDSIGLGEDGPTHQPVEHLAMLRATPNLNVFRPADIIETAEAWELALAARDRPSVLVLSRQAVPMLRARHTSENCSACGAYVLHETMGRRDVTLIATGSEVQVAKAASEELFARYGLQAAVVSMPCWELFERQSPDYRARVLGAAPRVAVEAAARLGWDRWMGARGAFIGMTGFGASAPAESLYPHFGITAEAVAEAALGLLEDAHAGVPHR